MKTMLLKVRITAEQSGRLVEAARAAGVVVSEYVRGILFSDQVEIGWSEEQRAQIAAEPEKVLGFGVARLCQRCQRVGKAVCAACRRK